MTKAAKKKQAAPSGFGNRKAEVKVMAMDNPNYSAIHAGAPGNPRTIEVAINIRESPIAAMFVKKHITEDQMQAAVKFRKLWETLGGKGVSAIDYTREHVDGGVIADPIRIDQAEAGRSLDDCRQKIGPRHYDVVRKVAGEGYYIANLSSDEVERRKLAHYLKDGLEDLAEHWGYKTRETRRKTA